MLGKAKLKPWEIGQLTMAEFANYVDEEIDTPRPPRGGQTFMFYEQKVAYFEWFRSLTPRQRFDMAKNRG